MIIKKILENFMKKSVKQRICLCIVLTAVLTILAFSIKAYFFDEQSDSTSQTEISQAADNNAEKDNSAASANNSPQFHISWIDVGVLLAAILAYSIHKIHEKRKQQRR